MPIECSDEETAVLSKVLSAANLPSFVQEQIDEGEFIEEDLKALNSLLLKLKIGEISANFEEETDEDEDEEDDSKDEDNE